MSAVVRWEDPTGEIWKAMLTSNQLGPHFSVKGNGRRATDEEIDEAIQAHEDGTWLPQQPSERLLEITALRDELGQTADPHVRQFVAPVVHAHYVEQVAAQRARRQ